MKTTTIIFSFLIILFSTGCIYKTPVQQGNILVQKDIDEIKPGMSKRQVVLTLGTPSVADPYNQDRWDYVNTYKVKGVIGEVKRLTLYFEDNKLVKTEGNYFPDSELITDSELIPDSQSEEENLE
jgi:outer membrane protein assembly factor BamE